MFGVKSIYTNFTDDGSPWALHPWIYNLTEFVRDLTEWSETLPVPTVLRNLYLVITVPADFDAHNSIKVVNNFETCFVNRAPIFKKGDEAVLYIFVIQLWTLWKICLVKLCIVCNVNVIHVNEYITCRVPFYEHGRILIPAWMSNYMSSKAWDEIIYQFSNLNCCAVEVWKWISNLSHTLVII